MSPVSDAPGRFVVLVGPDGVGKTSVARALLAHHRGPAAYFHFLPPLDGRWPAAPDPTSVPPPKARGRRICDAWLDPPRQKRCQMLAGLPEIRSASPQTGPPYRWRPLDVWVYRPTRGDEISRTRSVGARGSAFVAASTPDREPGRPAHVIRGRKQELTLSQIEQELLAWSSLRVPNFKTLDATRSPQDIAIEILVALASAGRTDCVA